MDKTWSSGPNDLPVAPSVPLPLKSPTSEETVIDKGSVETTERNQESKAIPLARAPVLQTPENKAEEMGKGSSTSPLNGSDPSPAENFCRDFCGTKSYEFVERIGEGGMGAVFKIRQIALDRLTAMKVLQLRNRAVQENDVGRFIREAQALAGLKKTNVGLRIPEIYDFGERGGFFYYLMQYIEGTSLKHRIAQRPIPVEEALPIVRELLQILQVVHQAGIIHRDIKPDNILLDAPGHCWLVDFGLARPTDPSDVQHTAPGNVLGTPPYMAPEHIHGKPTAQSDLYSVGAVLYEMLSGQRAVPGQTVSEIWASVFGQPTWEPPAANCKIKEELVPVCRRAMHHDLKKRYASAEVFQADVNQYIAAGTTTVVHRFLSVIRRSPGIVAAAVLLLLLAAAWSLVSMVKLSSSGSSFSPTPGQGDKVNNSLALPAQNGSSTVLPDPSFSPSAGATTEESVAQASPSTPREATSGEVSLTPPQFTVFRRRSKGDPWQEAAFLLSGDRYQIRLEVFQQSYIYGFQIDETGTITNLFPEADSRIPEKHRYSFSLPVAAKGYYIPSETGFFPLDQTPGFEEFCFLSSAHVLNQPEQRLRDYLAGRPLGPKIAIVVKRLEQRDVAPDQNQKKEK